jgi:hypothetical protein
MSFKTTKFISNHLYATPESSKFHFHRFFVPHSKTAVIFRCDLFEPEFDSKFHGIINDKEVMKVGLESRLSTFVCTVKPAALHLYALGEKLFFLNVHFPTKRVKNYGDLFRTICSFAMGLDVETSNTARNEWITEKKAWIGGGHSLRVFICGDFNNRNQDLLKSAPTPSKDNFQLLSPLRTRTSGNRIHGCAIDGVFVYPRFDGFKYNSNAHITTPKLKHDHKVIHTAIACADAHPIMIMMIMIAVALI